MSCQQDVALTDKTPVACLVLYAFSVGMAGDSQQPSAAYTPVASLQGRKPHAETGGGQALMQTQPGGSLYSVISSPDI